MTAHVAFITDQHFDRGKRWEEHLRIMDWIVRDLRERQPVAIALGGDIYEASPNPEEVRAACEWLVALANIAPVVGVRGNHDPQNSTAPFNLLQAAYPIRFYEAPAVHHFEWGAIACLPWPMRADLLALLPTEVPREQANQVATDALLAILRGMGSDLAQRDGCRLFLGHVQMRAATVSAGQPLRPGADFELGPEDLTLVGADAYLLGHIHRPSHGEMTINGAPCFYGGSPRRTAFGEVETKSYSLVSIDRPAIVSIVETPCTQMILAEDEWGQSAEGGYGWRDGWAGIGMGSVGGAEIRLRYRVASDQRDAARAAAERERLALLDMGAAAVKVEEQVRTVKRAKAPEVAQARSLPDKLDAYWASRGTTPDAERRARLMAKLGQLEAAAHNG